MELRLDQNHSKSERGLLALFALVLIPVATVLVQPDRAFSPLYHDCWLYHGYFIDLPGHLRAFGDHYYSSRLSMTLPGWLVYKLLPPLAANHVLHLGVYLVAVGSLYVVLRQTVNARAGLIVSLLFGGHYFFQIATTSDYFDGYAIAYFLLTIALLTNGERWRGYWIFAGMAATALVVANLMMGILLLPLAGHYLLVNRTKRVEGIFWLAVGALCLLGALAVFSKLMGGPFWFLSSSLRFAQAFQQHANPFKRLLGEWLPLASWLLVPIVAAIGGVVLLGVRKASGGREPPVDAKKQGAHASRSPYSCMVTWYQLQLLALLAILGLLEATDRHNLLQVWFYSSAFLVPLAFLAIGGQWGDWLTALSHREFVTLSLAAVVLPIVGTGVTGLHFPPLMLIVLALVATVLPTWRPQLATGLLAVTLFALGETGMRGSFRMEQTLPREVVAGLRLERNAEYDGRRAEVFLALHESMRAINRLDPTYAACFWFDIDEEHGMLFDNLACLHCWGKRLINTGFPELHPQWTPLRAGTRLLVVSSDPGVLPRLREAVRPVGLEIHPLHEQSAGRGTIRYQLHLVATEGTE